MKRLIALLSLATLASCGPSVQSVQELSDLDGVSPARHILLIDQINRIRLKQGAHILKALNKRMNTCGVTFFASDDETTTDPDMPAPKEAVKKVDADKILILKNRMSLYNVGGLADEKLVTYIYDVSKARYVWAGELAIAIPHTSLMGIPLDSHEDAAGEIADQVVKSLSAKKLVPECSRQARP